MEPVILSCAELSTREINAALAALPDGASARVLEPRCRHNLAVGLSNRVRIDIEGHAGYFIGGLGDGPDVVVHGFTGWSVGENLQAGSVRVEGNASECAGASSRGGTIVIEGDASSRAGISLKGGTILVGGNVGHMSGFMAQQGTLLVCGDAGEALGDSLYEARLYVRGSVVGLGADCIEKEIGDEHRAQVVDLLARAGITDLDATEFHRYGSARRLYNFHIDNAGAY
jgi:methylamine---glutamate N-methyltransferase subunit B